MNGFISLLLVKQERLAVPAVVELAAAAAAVAVGAGRAMTLAALQAAAVVAAVVVQAAALVPEVGLLWRCWCCRAHRN